MNLKSLLVLGAVLVPVPAFAVAVGIFPSSPQTDHIPQERSVVFAHRPAGLDADLASRGSDTGIVREDRRAVQSAYDAYTRAARRHGQRSPQAAQFAKKLAAAQSRLHRDLNAGFGGCATRCGRWTRTPWP